MAINSKLFDSIRISRKKNNQETETLSKCCQWLDCEKPGVYRAPAGRDREGQFFYFCIEHVREYNKNFNYFSGLTDDEIAKFQKDALTGNRPTWKSSTNRNEFTKAASEFSKIRSGSAVSQKRLKNPYAIFNEQRVATVSKRKIKPLELKALVTLDLSETASSTQIRSQYKLLIKRYHPDTNGGDRQSEERFREILQAYNLLKKNGFCD